MPSRPPVMGPFCAAIQMMFNTMGVTLGGFTAANWLPVHSWMVSGGDYSIYVHGDRFVLVETSPVDSFDELRRLLGECPKRRHILSSGTDRDSYRRSVSARPASRWISGRLSGGRQFRELTRSGTHGVVARSQLWPQGAEWNRHYLRGYS